MFFALEVAREGRGKAVCSLNQIVRDQDSGFLQFVASKQGYKYFIVLPQLGAIGRYVRGSWPKMRLGAPLGTIARSP